MHSPLRVVRPIFLSISVIILAAPVCAMSRDEALAKLKPVPASARGIELSGTQPGVQGLAERIESAQIARIDESTGAVQSLVGQLTAPGNGSAEERASSFLASQLGLPVNARGADALTVERVQDSGTAKHVTYAHRVNGFRVRGEKVAVHVNPEGAVSALSGTYHPAPVSGDAVTVDAVAATERAASFLEVQGLRAPARPERVWVPVDGTLVPAWEIKLAARQPLGDFAVVVDARNGGVIGGDEHLAFAEGTGSVYAHHPLAGDPVTVTLPNMDDSGNVSGAYAKVLNAKGAGATSTTHAYNFAPDDTHFDEVMCYYHLDKIHNYFAGIGFHDRDKPIEATVHYGDAYDNAFYSPWADNLSFGDGNKLNDLSKEDTVMCHEYTHAVSGSITDLSGEQGGAMNEGYSDYFACNLIDDPHIGVWVMHKLNRPWMRNCENTAHFPEDIHHEVHADSSIWSGACWDIRKALGADKAGLIVHKSRYYLGDSPDFVKGLEGCIAADKDLNAGANEATIRAAFQSHGVASTPPPHSRQIARQARFLSLGQL